MAAWLKYGSVEGSAFIGEGGTVQLMVKHENYEASICLMSVLLLKGWKLCKNKPKNNPKQTQTPQVVLLWWKASSSIWRSFFQS